MYVCRSACICVGVSHSHYFTFYLCFSLSLCLAVSPPVVGAILTPYHTLDATSPCELKQCNHSSWKHFHKIVDLSLGHNTGNITITGFSEAYI